MFSVRATVVKALQQEVVLDVLPVITFLSASRHP
jgi:hypothetical protein